MRWAMALGWLLSAGFLQAELPMDLNLPFVQTALIQEKTGEITEKAVRKGKINGEVLEFEKEEGGLLVLPRAQVVALLPRLPQEGVAYMQNEAQQALKILEVTQDKFPKRPEVAASVIAEWRKLSSSKTKHDQVRSAALDEWLKQSSRISSETAPEQLEKVNREGVELLAQFPDRATEIERELKGFKELLGIDLKKIDSVHFELSPFGENFIPGLVLWALLIIPLVVALKAFPEAFQGFREGVPLAGGLRLLIGITALTFVVLILLPGKKEGVKKALQVEATSTAARKAVWFSINHQEKWTNQNAKKITLPTSEWLAFLEEKIIIGNGADSFPYWYLDKPKILTTESSVLFLQPVRAKFISLPFLFNFSLPQAGQSLTGLELRGAALGKIPLGAAMGQLVWSLFQPSYQSLVEKCGLNQGIRWLMGEDGTVVIEVPEFKKPTPKAKESLSARELAETFDEGYGGIYDGKVVTVEGDLVQVVSENESLGTNTGLAVQDWLDEFILEGIPESGSRKTALRVRGLFKSPETYFLDAKGDLFRRAPNAQNPVSDIPILRRRNGITKVRLSEGRLESRPTETRLITLYDCRRVEGYDGKSWVVIWGN